MTMARAPAELRLNPELSGFRKLVVIRRKFRNLRRMPWYGPGREAQ